jgi:HEAT repeat protein
MEQGTLPDPETVKNSRDVGFLMDTLERIRWLDGEPIEEIHRCIKSALEGLRGSPEAEAVIRNLSSENERVRAGAVFAAGMIGDDHAIEPLLAIMRNPEEPEDLWSYAGQALGMIGDDRIVPDLETMLDSDEYMILDGALDGLGRLGARGVAVLVRALRHPDPEVRSGAALNLGYAKDHDAIEPLIRALRDPADLVRINAMMALAWIGDRRAAKPLAALLEDPDPTMRGYAVRALGEMQRSEAVDMLEQILRGKDPEMRLAAVETLMRLGAGLSRDVILRSLTYPDRRVRKSVSQTLDRTHRPGILKLHAAIGGMQWRPETPEEELAYCIAAEKWEECIRFGEDAVDPLIAVYPCGADCDTAIANALFRILRQCPVTGERKTRAIRLLQGEAFRTWRRYGENGQGRLC